MLTDETQTHLDRVSRQRRRSIGLVTVTVTCLLTATLWLQTVASGNNTLTLNYLIPLLAQLALWGLVHRWGVTGPIFVLLALTVGVGFNCSLFLPGAHGTFILIFFSAVPLFYILGGAVWGRFASAGFLALTFGLVVLKLLRVVTVWNLLAPQESVFAAIACILLQFIIAEANEREHRHRLQALVDHQFLEPNSGLPNWNSLSRQLVQPGQSLVLMKFGNQAFEETWKPGQLGRALGQLGFPGGVFWIAEDEYAVVEASGQPAAVVEQALGERLRTAALPGIPARSPVRLVCIRAAGGAEPAAKLLVEAELQLAFRSRAELPSVRSEARLQDLLRSLRSCFQEQRLAAVFQPIYDAEKGGIAALEALTRLDLDGTVVSPEPYLGLIGALGLDRQMTEFILREAVKVGLETEYSVSLNLTYRDLEDAGFLPTVLEACARFRNRRNKLILELTEHIAFSDRDLLAQFIAGVHDAGGLVFLDDFGMGYSNYASIAAARFDAIKVAGSIVLQAPASEEIRVLLSGVVKFAQASGIGLVAEHISDPGIFTMVRAEGVRYLQGYLLQKPVDGARILSGEFQFALEADHDFAAEVNARSVPFSQYQVPS